MTYVSIFENVLFGVRFSLREKLGLLPPVPDDNHSPTGVQWPDQKLTRAAVNGTETSLQSDQSPPNVFFLFPIQSKIPHCPGLFCFLSVLQW